MRVNSFSLADQERLLETGDLKLYFEDERLSTEMLYDLLTSTSSFTQSSLITPELPRNVCQYSRLTSMHKIYSGTTEFCLSFEMCSHAFNLREEWRVK